MKRVRPLLIVANLVLVLAFFGWSVKGKEQLLAEAPLVLLRLAPVDPRSLMQGDYMRLNYSLTDTIRRQQKRFDIGGQRISGGYVIVTLGDSGIARLRRFQRSLSPLSADEIPIRFWQNGWQVRIGAESYFFQEGQADKYSGAAFGALRVSRTGESVLVGLADSSATLIR
ncbi:MAG: GDYXXLXY domain-containing protein [Chitinophagaceae bacterium]|jgi:uncharacterized membrane-anchored protein|nr:GDYXXLXY domain-containing protein [Chitinophagaceae bacterium]